VHGPGERRAASASGQLVPVARMTTSAPSGYAFFDPSTAVPYRVAPATLVTVVGVVTFHLEMRLWP